MQLGAQRRIAAQLMKCSESRVVFNPERLDEVKEAITKSDIRGLIGDGVIKKRQEKGVSRVRANHFAAQRAKGRSASHGNRKGRKTARLPTKQAWMTRVRVQRGFLKELKQKNYLEVSTYRDLYGKVKSGFFRNKRHIKLYIEEKELTKN